MLPEVLADPQRLPVICIHRIIPAIVACVIVFRIIPLAVSLNQFGHPPPIKLQDILHQSGRQLIEFSRVQFPFDRLNGLPLKTAHGKLLSDIGGTVAIAFAAFGTTSVP